MDHASYFSSLFLRDVTTYIQKVWVHNDISGNDEVDKLAKCSFEQPILEHFPFYLIGHTTPYWLAGRSTSTQNDGSICNCKYNSEKELLSITLTYVDKWLSNKDIHHPWSNLLWNTPSTIDDPITQLLKFAYTYIGKCPKIHHLLRLSIMCIPTL